MGPDRCFFGPVAVAPYTDENRAAHGGITCIEECRACGARRTVNRNGWHMEYSPWGETRATRQAQASVELDRALRGLPSPVVVTRGDVRALNTGDIMLDAVNGRFQPSDEAGIIAAAGVLAAALALRSAVTAEDR